ncbi:unnamed protein product [Strongylus vulgaris]|uniref:Uncharacterized protein n=1 Tax=Strongylus vulgaris TaxID=40348 RepID=A0A3P7I763_STRVU|nr:unnamed protein product [Strongylus vulgaris]
MFVVIAVKMPNIVIFPVLLKSRGFRVYGKQTNVVIVLNAVSNVVIVFAPSIVAQDPGAKRRRFGCGPVDDTTAATAQITIEPPTTSHHVGNPHGHTASNWDFFA